jgi:hypothetical protein
MPAAGVARALPEIPFSDRSLTLTRYERSRGSADDLEGLMMELAAVSRSGATFDFQPLPPFPITFWRRYA